MFAHPSFQRLNYWAFMRSHREEAESFHGYGWSEKKMARVRDWGSFRASFAEFLAANYVLVPPGILEEGGPLAVVRSKIILKREDLHVSGKDDGKWGTFVWKCGVMEGRCNWWGCFVFLTDGNRKIQGSEICLGE